MLLLVQAVAVALGALPVYRLGRKHLGSERAALLRARLPAHAGGRLDDAERVPSGRARDAVPALRGLVSRRGPAGRVRRFAALAVATKEHVGLAVALLGVWHALWHRRRRAGLVIAAAGVAVSALAVAVVIPHYRPAGGPGFYGRFDAIGGSPADIARTAVTDPLAIWPRRPRAATAATSSTSCPARRPRPARAARAARRPARARAEPALGHRNADVDSIFSTRRRRSPGSSAFRARRGPPRTAAPACPRSALAAGGRGCNRGETTCSDGSRRPAPSPAETARRPGRTCRGCARARPGCGAGAEVAPDGAVVTASNSLGGHLSERRGSSASRSWRTPSGLPWTETAVRATRTGSVPRASLRGCDRARSGRQSQLGAGAPARRRAPLPPPLVS